MSAGGLSRARLARMRETMSRHVESGALPGLVTVVSRRGEAHLEAIGKLSVDASDPMPADAIFRIASLTKPVTAVAALILVEECVLRLDEPVDRFLPELANRKVLRSLEAAVDETVAAERPLTLRDLLTFRLGYGFVMAPPGRYPIQKALAELGLAPGPDQPTFSPDEFLRRLGSVPLVHQPGARWLYHTGSDVLGVLIARASGQSLGEFMRERIFAPLGMSDTGFHVPPEKLARLGGCYRRANRAAQSLDTYDPPGAASRFARPPAFEAGGGGLVATAGDYLAFCEMLLGKGRRGSTRILSRPAVELMITNQLSDEQTREAAGFLDGRGWGFGVAVVTRRDDLSASPGRFGWEGGYGTSGHTDPAEQLIGILMTQVMMDSPQAPAVYQDFWTSAYQAIDD